MAKRQTIIKEVIFGSVACDYVSLTTFSLDTFRDWETIVERMKLGEPSAQAYSQYRGQVWGNDVELMEGEQKGIPHYMFICKGANADVAIRHMAAWGYGAPESISCTRFDVQITLSPKKNRPPLMEIVGMWERGFFSPFKGRGKPVVWGYTKEGKQTLYIGSEQSDVFARIYDKLVARIGKEETIAERYEVTFKARRSEVLWRKVMQNTLYFSDKAMRDALIGHIVKLPPEMRGYFAAGTNEDIGGDPWEVERTKKGPPDGYKWFMTLPDALVRIASDPTPYGEEVRRMLVEIFARAVEGRNPSPTDEWALVSPRGKVYNPHGIAYNDFSGDGGITIKNVRHSKITIGDMVGRDRVQIETASVDPPTGPESE